MKAVKNIVNRFNRRLFDSVVHNKLIYNCCWEDPKIDRELLQIDSASRVLMLTSAGCNALNYLLDNPAQIHCVDINPAQNALLELKCSLFRNGEYQLLWKMFGRGQFAGATALYHQTLRKFLSPSAQTFWDDHLDYFSPSNSTGSFYYRGTSGGFANLICNRLRHKGLFESINNLLEAKSLPEQRYYFGEIEPHLWNSFSRWLIKQNATMALLGVPKTQRVMIDNEVSGGLAAFIHQAVKSVFTERPVDNNYFWRVYLTGSYSRDCCPAYLHNNKFISLRKRIERLCISNSSILYYLKKNPEPYSHFVLLDHQDWLAYYQPVKLIKEWKLILRHARPGAKILFRSAGATRSFLPDFIDRYVHFKDDETGRLHPKDRVGTYGSTHLAVVDKLL